MKRCVYLFLLSILLVAGLTACGSGKAEQEVPSLTEIEGMTKYDIPATTSTDTDLNALPVSWVSLPAVS